MDVLKITSAVPAAKRLDNLPKQLPGDAVFDIGGAEGPPARRAVGRQERQEGQDGSREALLRSLNKEILAPLRAGLSAQSEGLKKLVAFLRFFDDPQLAARLGDPDELFLNPNELLDELLERDRAATVFRGELFEALRELAKAEGFPRLREAIVALLRAFDGNVNGGAALLAVFEQSLRLASLLKPDDAGQVGELLARMAAMSAAAGEGEEGWRAMSALLKNQLLPLLTDMSQKYQFLLGNRLEPFIQSVIHNVTRFDKSDPRLPGEAMGKLGEELRSFGRLGAEDVEEMRQAMAAHLKEARAAAPPLRQEAMAAGLAALREEKAAQAEAMAARAAGSEPGAPKAAGGEVQGGRAGVSSEALARASGEAPRAGAAGDGKPDETAPKQAPGGAGGAEDGEARAAAGRRGGDLSQVLARALEAEAAAQVNAAAQAMLAQMVQNESPVLALLHFLFPVKYKGEDVYSEFYVDKDGGRKDGGGAARNIFFVIRSEVFGDFAVDLLERDRTIELDISCPPALCGAVKASQQGLKGMMEGLGYRMAAFRVGETAEERSIMQRFPELAMNGAGIDIRI
ncbi:MAG: hypothetical protein LBG71_04490 [Clostridiales Family XIII bacterium]|jgi:hypothetical protein|nr:hypothetical protein [Clostridiales Family XIII bacterium]